MPEQDSQFVASKEKQPRVILVAEDARCVQRNLSHVLESMNLRFEMAENGLVACQMAERSLREEKPYDLILMDVQMPVMSGLNATHHLRKIGWTGPIVAVSVFAERQDHTELWQAGYDDYIAKPLTRKKLEKVLSRYIELDHTDEPSERKSGPSGIPPNLGESGVLNMPIQPPVSDDAN